MVLTVRVWAVVGYVTVDAGETALSASLVRKTSAKPGAGTDTAQVLAVVSHCTVVRFRSPTSRPSEPKLLPSVCGGYPTVRLHTARKRYRTWPAQVKLPFAETESAKRYL